MSEGPALPAGRCNHAGGVVGGWPVVVGGTAWSADRKTKHWLKDSLVFSDGKWSPGPPLPHAVSEPMFASDNSGVYIAGGRRGAAETNDAVYRLSNVGGQLGWQTLARLPVTRTAGAAGIIDGRFIVTCGSTNDVPTNRTWALDITSGDATWRDCAPLPGPPRMYPAVAICGKFLYLFGGMRPTEEPAQSGMEVFKDVYRYDLKADVWERLPDLPTRGYCWAASAIDDESVVLAGRADGAIHDDVWHVNLSDMRVQGVERLTLRSTCAPLVRIDPNTWWLIGGEPDSLKTRTEKVTVIKRLGQ
ncbi:MAG TPA: kelch repeat-containing protein [Tepidisphaeraceae bacterium]|nr:kelch repeat-containing protein [Tepidisphaeraceae bacterium]